jgi:cation diffusion facilitator family transporter
VNQSLSKTDRLKIKIQWITLLVSLALLIFKFIAYFATNSNSILSDAMESIINVTASAFALFSIYYAARPQDFNHPYGHGKIEFVTSGVEGFLILVTGLFLIYKGTYNIIYPQEIQALGFGLIVVAIGAIVNLGLGIMLKTSGKKFRSPVLESEGNHILSDSYSSFGLIAGIGLIMLTKIEWLDNLVTIIFGVLIIYMGYKIIRKSFKGIMDEADFSVLKELVELLSEKRQIEWIDIHNLRLIKYGSSYHFDIHLTIPFYFTIKEGEKITADIEFIIKEKYGENVESFIHIDACSNNSCELCQISNCTKRMKDFKHRVEWNIDNVLVNSNHIIE